MIILKISNVKFIFGRRVKRYMFYMVIRIKKVIINISEDAWFGNSIGPYQHFSKSVFRAVESDSFVVRSTNKGVSAIINNKGQIVKSLKNNESGNIEYRLPIFENSGRNKNDLIFFLLLFTYGLIFLNYKKNDY